MSRRPVFFLLSLSPNFTLLKFIPFLTPHAQGTYPEFAQIVHCPICVWIGLIVFYLLICLCWRSPKNCKFLEGKNTRVLWCTSANRDIKSGSWDAKEKHFDDGGTISQAGRNCGNSRSLFPVLPGRLIIIKDKWGSAQFSRVAREENFTTCSSYWLSSYETLSANLSLPLKESTLCKNI